MNPFVSIEVTFRHASCRVLSGVDTLGDKDEVAYQQNRKNNRDVIMLNARVQQRL